MSENANVQRPLSERLAGLGRPLVPQQVLSCSKPEGHDGPCDFRSIFEDESPAGEHSGVPPAGPDMGRQIPPAGEVAP